MAARRMMTGSGTRRTRQSVRNVTAASAAVVQSKIARRPRTTAQGGEAWLFKAMPFPWSKQIACLDLVDSY